MSKTTAFLILFTLISTISGQGFLSKNQVPALILFQYEFFNFGGKKKKNKKK